LDRWYRLDELLPWLYRDVPPPFQAELPLDREPLYEPPPDGREEEPPEYPPPDECEPPPLLPLPPPEECDPPLLELPPPPWELWFCAIARPKASENVKPNTSRNNSFFMTILPNCSYALGRIPLHLLLPKNLD